MKQYTTDELKEELTSRGFYLGNLWSIQDVQQNYKVSDDDAQEVLDFAFNMESTVARIFDSIDRSVVELGENITLLKE